MTSSERYALALAFCLFSLDSAKTIRGMLKLCFCQLTCALLFLSVRVAPTSLNAPLLICTNTIDNLDKYNSQFREIHFTFSFAFSKYQGCGCLQPASSLNAGLLTHRAISPRTLSATAINFLSHSQRGKYTHTHILSEHCQALSMLAQILKYCQKPNIRSGCARPVTILTF